MATDIRPRGSRNNECAFCGDDAAGACSCGAFVCRDCRIDHPCTTVDEEPKKKLPKPK